MLVCHGTAARPAASAVDSSGVAPFIVGFYRDILRRGAKVVLYLLKDSKPQAKPNKFSGNAKVHVDRNWHIQRIKRWSAIESAKRGFFCTWSYSFICKLLEAQIMHDSWFDFALNKFHWHIFYSPCRRRNFPDLKVFKDIPGGSWSRRDIPQVAAALWCSFFLRIRAWQIDGRQDPPRLGQGLTV